MFLEVLNAMLPTSGARDTWTPTLPGSISLVCSLEFYCDPLAIGNVFYYLIFTVLEGFL